MNQMRDSAFDSCATPSDSDARTDNILPITLITHLELGVPDAQKFFLVLLC